MFYEDDTDALQLQKMWELL